MDSPITSLVSQCQNGSGDSDCYVGIIEPAILNLIFGADIAGIVKIDYSCKQTGHIHGRKKNRPKAIETTR